MLPISLGHKTAYGTVAWQERRSGHFFPYDLSVYFCLCTMPYHLSTPEQEWPPGDPRNRMYLVEKHQK